MSTITSTMPSSAPCVGTSGDGLLTASVGDNGGVNLKDDTTLVQQLLNMNPDVVKPPLVPDGKCGRLTIAGIRQYQRGRVGLSNPDGRVDPGGKTITQLARDAVRIPEWNMPDAPPVPVKPGGDGTFMGYVNSFVDHVKKTYGVTITVTSSSRTADTAQKMHVAHMIKFNHFNSRVPKHWVQSGSSKLIAFDHLSDASVVWGGGMEPSYFLRDAAGNAVSKNGGAWSSTPDETKTRARALAILKAHGVGSTRKGKGAGIAHGAMVACGVNGCAEPCLCGGGRSRHVAGKAADLGNMEQLRQKLSPATDASIDKLLKQYQLHRPIVRQEPWHVELIE